MENIKTQLNESYAKFLKLSENKVITKSKKHIDELYKNTRNKLKDEEIQYNNKSNKYSLYPDGVMRDTKYLSEITLLFNHLNKQMKPYISDKYIYEFMASYQYDADEEDAWKEEEEKHDKKVEYIKNILLTKPLFRADEIVGGVLGATLLKYL